MKVGMYTDNDSNYQLFMSNIQKNFIYMCHSFSEKGKNTIMSNRQICDRHTSKMTISILLSLVRERWRISMLLPKSNLIHASRMIRPLETHLSGALAVSNFSLLDCGWPVEKRFYRESPRERLDDGTHKWKCYKEEEAPQEI